MRRTIRQTLLMFLLLVPWTLRRRVYNRWFGANISSNARIGFSFIDVDRLEMAPGSWIGSFNAIRNLDLLRLEQHSCIGTFNWISGLRGGTAPGLFSDFTDRKSIFELAEHSALTSRHFVDCIEKVYIGRYSTVAGIRSQLLTHAIEFSANRQACAPITIGEYCFVGTGAILLKGTVVPDYCIVGAGAVVSGKLEEPACLYAGNPARKVRNVNKDEGYFVRNSGFVR